MRFTKEIHQGCCLSLLVQQHDPLRRVMADGSHDAVGHIWIFQIGNIRIRQQNIQRIGCIVQILYLGCADSGRCHTRGPMPCQRDFLHLRAGPIIMLQCRPRWAERKTKPQKAQAMCLIRASDIPP